MLRRFIQIYFSAVVVKLDGHKNRFGFVGLVWTTSM